MLVAVSLFERSGGLLGGVEGSRRSNEAEIGSRSSSLVSKSDMSPLSAEDQPTKSSDRFSSIEARSGAKGGCPNEVAIAFLSSASLTLILLRFRLLAALGLTVSWVTVAVGEGVRD